MLRILVFVLSLLLVLPAAALASLPERGPTPAISGGAEAATRAQQVIDFDLLDGSATEGVLGAAAYTPGTGFDAYNFDDNGTLTGYLFIPPDPIGAAGTDRVIAVVNVGIECRNKSGTLLYRSSLKNFFTSVGYAGTLGTFMFDPKIVYDPYENRFVVVALEKTDVTAGGSSDASRILVAVSKTSAPASATASDWYYFSIDSKITVGGVPMWADYPGLEVDEEAVYITMNYFNFGSPTTTYDQRLWIIPKGTVSGFYAGGTATASAYDAYTGAGLGGYKATTMPAQVHGTGGVGTGIGTFLLSYGGLTGGGMGQPEYLLCIRVDNPTGTPTFLGEFIQVGNIEDVGGGLGYPNLPDAPQSGSAYLIEVNDRRALDAVWRNGYLYLTTTINPNASDPVNTGTATAHIFKLDATAVTSSSSGTGLISLAAETNIGAEDVATATYTFFPSVAVNSLNHVFVGFAGSASTIYAGAYAAEINQTTFTPGSTATVRAGTDYYLRTFTTGSTGRNRWGDYSGISVDPADNVTFWVFNQWAMTRGSASGGEDGRWATAWKSFAQPATDDFGDAPPPYPTLLAAGGAHHQVIPGVFLGSLIDIEADGIPHPNALGDDLTAAADEDGLIGASMLTVGQPANLQVLASAMGWLDVWIDYNQNGSWLDAGELIYSAAVIPGINNVLYTIPATATVGTTFLRMRYNTLGPLPPTGAAADGEVEDYQVVVNAAPEDFGDAPGPYPTLLAANGARHTIVPGVFLGGFVDNEPDGQPDPLALGDDNDILYPSLGDDEDGVVVVIPFTSGGSGQIDVIASTNGWVDAWVDWYQNGNWTDPVDLIYSGPVIAGLNSLPIPVPAGLPAGQTFMRVRYNTSGLALAPTGSASDGEVEDYIVDVFPGIDLGDAPDAPYPTLLASNGASHSIVPGVFLGAGVDPEPDGQPDPAALGDDNDLVYPSAGDDEDGVAFPVSLIVGQPGQVDVVASLPGWLDVYIDFDQNGSWLDPPDLAFSGPVVAGLNPVPFPIPPTALAGSTYMRVRYNLSGPLPPTGAAPDGEVEDYLVEILEPDYDFGDAPDPGYPTKLANNGARHIIVPGIFLGTAIDAETDGQPSAAADGDDLNGVPNDEDGVVFATPLAVNTTAQIDVVASTAGWLDVWIDFDGNGTWDATDLAYSGGVSGGLNSLAVSVPVTAVTGGTFVRVRFNTGGTLPVTGRANDGEVEDYAVTIEPEPLDYGDAPDPSYPTLLASNGARHRIDPTVYMGSAIDGESDGQPTAAADGDDVNGSPDDEDGVTFTTDLVIGNSAGATVVVSANGYLDAWIDFDMSGSWDAGERIYTGTVSAGSNAIAFTVPLASPAGTTFARFRYNTTGALADTGFAADGEVEDYEVLLRKRVGLPGDVTPQFGLAPARPNPFSGRAEIAFSTEVEGRVVLRVFTMGGRLVATLVDAAYPAGSWRSAWDGRDDAGKALPSGVYLYQLVSGGRTATGKVMLLH